MPSTTNKQARKESTGATDDSLKTAATKAEAAATPDAGTRQASLYAPSESYNTVVGVRTGVNNKRSSMGSTTTASSSNEGTSSFQDTLDNFPFDDEEDRLYMSQWR